MSRLLQALVPITCVALLACPPAEPAADEGTAEETAGLQSDDDKTLYTIGQLLARSVAPLGLSDAELDTLVDGLRDGALGAEPQVDLREQGPKVQAFTAARMKAVADSERDAGSAWVLEAAAAEGAEQTDSGLVFRSTGDGEGDSPQATDRVKVHYTGTLRDGTVFDSSRERGEPAVFPLNRVIPCWTEALQRMKPGGTAEIVCPSDIAYGDRGSGQIPPGAAIAFDVELIEVVAAPAPPSPHGAGAAAAPAAEDEPSAE